MTRAGVDGLAVWTRRRSPHFSLRRILLAWPASMDAGWPCVVPCWHEWDGSSFWVISREKSAWALYLANDSRCAICVNEAEELRKVVARCTAHTVEEPNSSGELVPIAGRMSTRYLGENDPKYLGLPWISPVGCSGSTPG